jgi:hypothetical protein
MSSNIIAMVEQVSGLFIMIGTDHSELQYNRFYQADIWSIHYDRD